MVNRTQVLRLCRLSAVDGRVMGWNPGAVALRRVVRRLDRFLLVVLSVLGFYFIVRISESPGFIDLANLLGPVVIGLSAAWTAYRLLRYRLVIWTPWLWFLGAIVLFYSLGPLAYVLGSDEVKWYLRFSLPITVLPEDLFITNLLNVVGIASILVGIRLGHAFLPFPGLRKLESRQADDVRRIKVLAVLLLVLGGGIQYLLILPWELGFFTFVLPGVIYNLAKLHLFGLLVLAYVIERGVKRWKWLLYGLWGLQLMLAFIHFSKTEVIITMLLPSLGAYMAHGKMKRLLVTFAAMAVVYVSISQMIHYGRHEAALYQNDARVVGIQERLAILSRWFGGEGYYNSSFVDMSAYETGWTRLSYTNVQKFAMDQYDVGEPGRTLEMITWVLIPRIVWPEKPYTTDASIDFYELVTGRRGKTHLGLGIFGESYWNYGWTGVLAVGIAAGLIFWLVGIFAWGWMRRRRMEYLPSIFLGINMGLLGTTQFFANAFIGGGGYILVYAFVVSKAMQKMLPGQR